MSDSQPTPIRPPRVFISYSHDSEEHCNRVLDLAQQLQCDGVDAELDQYHQEELIHWPRWCEEQLRPENSDFVLCICTEEYKRRVEGRVKASVGKGVFWEGTIIYNNLYDEKGNQRCVPILLGDGDEVNIPHVLRGYTFFQLREFDLGQTKSDYAKLYRLLTGERYVETAAHGSTKKLPSLPLGERRTDFTPFMRHNLPASEGKFIGDEKRYTEPIMNLESKSFISLHGSPGRGKTRLVLQIAEVVLREQSYCDGIWFIPLETVETPERVPKVVWDTMGLKMTGDVNVDKLAAYIGDGCVLVIFDGCEDVQQAVSSLARELLDRCRNLRIVATSQLEPERGSTFRVPLLSLPPMEESRPTAEQVRRFEAVQFFLSRAEYYGNPLSLTDDNAPELASLCWELNGVPLELDLAATHLRELSLKEIKDGLGKRFSLLSREAGALSDRRSLQATIEWSYRLLKPAERRLLATLSILVGSWTREAALAVCGPGMTDAKLQKLLGSLVSKSFLERETTKGDKELRFYMLRSFREFGRRKLSKKNAEAAQRRHFDHYFRIGIEGEKELKGERQEETLRGLEADHENLRTAVEWSLKDRQTAVEGLKLACAMRRFWFLHGYYKIGRQMLQRALENANPGERTALRAQALLDGGILARVQSDYINAERLLDKALEIFREVGDDQGTGAALNALGILDVRRENWARAKERFEEALQIAESLQNDNLQAWVLNGLGDVAFRQHRVEEARAYHARSRSIKEALGDRRGEAMSLEKLGEIALAGKDLETARTCLEKALEIRRRLDYRAGIASMQRHLARLEMRQGQTEQARRRLQEVLQIAVELGDNREVTVALLVAAELAGLLGERARSGRYIGVAEALGEEMGVKFGKDIDELLESIPAEDEGELQRARENARALSWRDTVDDTLAWLETPAPVRGGV